MGALSRDKLVEGEILDLEVDLDVSALELLSAGVTEVGVLEEEVGDDVVDGEEEEGEDEGESEDEVDFSSEARAIESSFCSLLEFFVFSVVSDDEGAVLPGSLLEREVEGFVLLFLVFEA